jgi:hypothetical protein
MVYKTLGITGFMDMGLKAVPPTLLSEDGNIFLTVSGTSWSLEQ